MDALLIDALLRESVGSVPASSTHAAGRKVLLTVLIVENMLAGTSNSYLKCSPKQRLIAERCWTASGRVFGKAIAKSLKRKSPDV